MLSSVSIIIILLSVLVLVLGIKNSSWLRAAEAG